MGKIEFWNYNSIHIYQTFYQQKRLTGVVLSISENLRVKGEGHHMTKYGQKYSFGATTPLKYSRKELL